MADHSGLDMLDEKLHTAESTLGEFAGRIREKGAELGKKAAASLDDRRVAAADGLEGAARGLHDRADSIAGGGERLSKATHEVADKVDSASRYIRQNDSKEMLSDVESMVRAHPTRSLLAVLAVGYFIGRAIRRD